MGSAELMLKLVELIPEEPVSIYKLSRNVNLDQRTIKKYLDVIISIQSAKRIRKDLVGLRVLIKRER